ncbi:MAG TPA: ABC transporter permease [Gammaproteobacteria bacterium]|nr:ABC transporter permease [Gammaproteobacteria bacterium]
MLGHYVAIALRNLRRAPGTAALNMLTLAIGLVAIVTAYAYVAYLDRADTQFPNADRIHLLTMSYTLKDNPFPGISAGVNVSVPEQAAAYLREDFPAIEKIARALSIQFFTKMMIASGEHAEQFTAVGVDPEFFEIFPLRFVAGDAASALRSPGSVVLTQEYARKLFDEKNPLGQHVVLQNAVEATVTGVLAPLPNPSHMGHETPSARLKFDALVSLDVREAVLATTMQPQQRKLQAESWFSSNATTYVVLPERGLSAQALRSQLGGFVQRHVPPDRLQGAAEYSFGVMPLHELLTQGDMYGTGLSFGGLLLVLGTLVLAVACVNYANLATARASRRAREIGVRKAIGAAPKQVLLQSLIEAGLLTAGALVLAVAAFLLGGPVMRALLDINLAPTLFASWRAWPFLLGVVVAVTVAAGAYPAFVLSRVRPANAIAAANVALGSKLFSLVLVGTQFAIASLLLLVVTFVTLQNRELARSGLGVAEDPLMVIENPTVTKVEAATLRAELARVPGVTGVTEVAFVPWEMTMVSMVNGSTDPTSPQHRILMRRVGLDFSDVFGIDRLAGRLFDATDLPPPGAPVAPTPGSETKVVVDRAFAGELGYATPEAAVGNAVYQLQNLPPGSNDPPKEPVTWRIVGVVEDRAFSYWGFADARAAVYQLNPTAPYTVARISRSNVSGALAEIDALWRRLAPNVAFSRRFMDDIFNQAYSQFVRTNRLFGLLALMAFAISVAGLFGMAALVTARRRPEIGLRKTLGASTPQVLRLLLTSFSKPVIIANLLAWPLGFVAARVYLKQFLNPIPITPLPFVASLVVTVAIAWLAVGSQTWRAARLKPADVLRHE